MHSGVPNIATRTENTVMPTKTPARDRAEMVREKLVIDDDMAFEAELAKSVQVLKLDSKGGIHPVAPLSSFANRQKIELVLLGRRMAHAGGLLASDAATDSEVAKFLGLSVREVQKRAHDLRVLGRIEALGDGSYRIVDGRVQEVLADLGAT